MPGRKYTVNSSYRYGFNGQENSDEIAAGLTTALFWEYDSKIGRRWNVDPVEKTEESPYLCFSGNPILISDEDGDDGESSIDGDPVKKPRVSNDNKSKNSNRYKKAWRTPPKKTKKPPYQHTGTDILAKPGSKIQSVLNGVVVDVNNNSSKATNGYGNTVVVRSVVNGKYVYIFYGHLQKAIVKEGDVVTENKPIAIAGQTGNAANIKSKFAHVHIEAATEKPNAAGTYYGSKKRINPENYFDTQFDENGEFASFKQSRVKSSAYLKKVTTSEVKAVVTEKNVKVNQTIKKSKLSNEDQKVLEEIKRSNPKLFPKN